MSDFSVEKTLEKLEKELDRIRYLHTLGVAYTAAGLAMSLGMDKDKAFIAGLLHDCAKRVKTSSQIELAEKLGVRLSEEDKNSPGIIHAINGVEIARIEYGIKDEEILSSIRYHTTGRPGMTVLEKIIFVADYIEPLRDKQPRLSEIRKAAFENLDASLVMILEDTIDYLKTNSPTNINSMTDETYRYYTKEK